MKNRKSKCAALAASAVILSVCANVSHAAVVTWDASGSNPAAPTDGGGNWNTTDAANWSNGASDSVWTTGNTAAFGAANGAAGIVTINDASGTVSAAGVNFNAAGSGNYTVVAAGGTTLTLTSPTITVAAGVSPTISAPIAGGTGLTMAGAGALTLTGTNTYTGATLVSNGTLTVGSGGNLGAAANTLTLGATPGDLTDTTPVAVNINSSVAVGGLTVDVNSVTANVFKIASGQTMTVNGAASIGLGSATIVTNTVVTTGAAGSGGELDVNGNFTVGLPNTNATSTKNTATADLSGLSAFRLTAATGTLNIGQGANTKGTLTLASGVSSSNILNVQTINDGVSGSSNANAGCILNLGSGTNVIQASSINIGTGKSSGVIQFVSGAPASASVTITGLNGSGTADITIGNQTSGTATGNNSGLSFAGKTANISAGTVIAGRASGNSGGGGLGSVTFDTGTFNVNNLNLGIVAGSTTNGTGAVGTFTLGTNSTSTGVLTVNTSFVLASNTNTAANPGTATGNFVINGGTANINTNIISTGTKGTTTGSITLAGGVLDMMNHSIGGAVANSGNDPIALTATKGTIQNLVELNGGGALTKSGTATLVLAGVDKYTGPTNITAGTLDVDGTHTGGGLYTVSALATLGGDGSTTAPVMVIAGGNLSPGDSIHSLGVGSTTLNGTLNIELNDADANVVDLLNVAGSLDISSATSGVNFSVTGTPSHAAYVFANYTSLSGAAFASVQNLPAGYSIDYNYQGANDIALVAAPIPEPTSIGLAVISGLGMAARRRRRA